jgi:hypothetical protein
LLNTDPEPTVIESGSTTGLFVIKFKKWTKMCSFYFIFLPLDPDSESGSTMSLNPVPILIHNPGKKTVAFV